MLNTSDANADNEKAFRELIAALKRNRPLGLVGAGVSVRAGYPTWKRLLQRLHERAESRANWSERERVLLLEHPDLPWRAGVYREVLTPKVFDKFLQLEFSEKGHPIDSLSRNLVKAGFSHFLTTNYDSVLERAQPGRTRKKESRCVRWEDRDAVREFITTLGDNGNTLSRVVYLHGRFDKPQHLVLTEQSYLDRYVKSDDSRKKLFAIFATKRVVFIGFSLDDPDLSLLLREMTASLGDQRGRHFVLMALKESEEHPNIIRARLTAKFGVIPIFFPYSLDYKGLDEVVEALVRRDPSALPKLHVATPKPTKLPWTSVDPEDPQKGRWGGKSKNAFRSLRAKVTDDGDGWYTIHLCLRSTRKDKPLRKPIQFHLHDSFSPQVTGPDSIEESQAILELSAYGAFTVGVEADDGQTKLELDLAKLKSAPSAFRNA